MEIQGADGERYVVNLPSGMTPEGTRVAVVNTENGPVTVIFMDEVQDTSTGGEVNLSGADALNNILNMPGVEVSVMDGNLVQDSTSENFIQNTTSESLVQDARSQNFVQVTTPETIVHNTDQGLNQNLNVDSIQTLRNETPGLVNSTIDQVKSHEFYALPENGYGDGNVAGLVSNNVAAYVDNSTLKGIHEPQSFHEHNPLNELTNADSSRLENVLMNGMGSESSQSKERSHDILGQALLSASLNSNIIQSDVSDKGNKTNDLEETVSGPNLDSLLSVVSDKCKEYKKEATSTLKFKCTLCAESFEKMNLLLKHRANDHSITAGTEHMEIINPIAKEKIEADGSVVNDMKDIQEKVVQFEKEVGKEGKLKNKKNAAITHKKLSTKRALTSNKKKNHGISKPLNKPDHSTGFKVVLRCSLNKKQSETFSFRKNEFCNVNHAIHEAHLKHQDPDERLLNMGPKEIFFKCVYCHQCFTDRAETKSHVSVHRTVCFECGVKCLDLARLRRHRLNVHKSTKDGIFDCVYCKKMFGNKPDLMAHMKVHVGPWICERTDCGVQFNERKYLVLHRKSHGHNKLENGKAVFDTGEKMTKPEGLTIENVDDFIEQKSSFKDTGCGRVWAPARCKICREQFTRVSMVRKHIKMVHFDRDAKKLQCDQCDYKTQFGYVLEKHKQIHRKQYKCDICTKTFDYESSLKNHLASHAKAKFQCYYCSQRFITREKCIEHLTSVHKDQKTKSTEKSEKETTKAEPKVEDKKSLDVADKVSIEGQKSPKEGDTELGNENEELDDSKTTNTDKKPEEKPNTSLSGDKPNTMENSTDLNQVGQGMAMDLENVTYIDSHGQSVQDLVVPGNEPELKSAKPGYRIAPQTIEVPNSDVTLDLLADGTIITKDKQGTNFSEIKLESLGIDMNSLEGQTNIELVIVQSNGTEVKATIQAVVEKNQTVSPVKAKMSEPTLAALNAMDNGADNEAGNKIDNMLNNDKSEQNNTSEERLYKCSKCPRTFKYFNTYKCHESVHDRDVTYTCPLCFRVFAKSKNLTTHLELHKAKLGEEKYLSAMKETEESEIAAVESRKNKEFKCDHCNKVFPHKSKLTRHIKQSHETKKYLSCPHCPKEFLGRKAYDKHVATHTGSFDCSVCGENFSTNQEYSEHLKEKHFAKNRTSSRTRICPICKISQGSRDNFAKHLRQKHGNSDEANKLLEELKIFKCDLCNARFHRKSKLNAHILVHARGKRFHCQYCSERFEVKQKLLDHYRQEHNEDLKNPCKICMKNFLTKEKLSEHNKKVHSNSYRCGTCEQLFADYDTYCRHIFDEHGDGVACDICNEIFLTQKSLLQHTSIKHAKRTKHVCSVCGVEFGKATELRNHEIEEHAEDTVWDIENDTIISDPKSTLSCDLCNFEVVDEFLYRQHYLMKHFKGDEEAMLNEYPNLTAKADSGQSLIICDHCGNDFPGIDELNKHLTSLGLETLTYIDNKEKEISPRKKNEKKDKLLNDLSILKDKSIESEEFEEVEFNEDDEDFLPEKIKKPVGKKKSNKLSNKKTAQSDDKELFLENNFSLGKIGEQGNSPVKSHKCYICGARFSTEKALNKHAETHDDESDVDEQIMKENNIKPITFKCEKCGNSYATAFGLKTHHRHKHSDSSTSKKIKGNEKKSQGKLNTYIGLFRKKLPMTTLKDKKFNQDFTKTESGEYLCPQCPAIYKNFIGISHHTKMKHPVDTPVKTEQTSPARVSTSGRVIKKSLKTIDQMQCEICYKQFSLESSLLKHMVKRHQLNTNNKDEEVKDHDTTAVNENVTSTFCKICKGNFKNFGSHLYHKHKDLYFESKLKKESSGKKIKKERVSSEEIERGHVSKKHKLGSYSTSIFKFQCKSCPRKFKTDYLLKLHTKSHKMKNILKAVNKPKDPEIDVEEEIDVMNDDVDDKELNLLLYKCKNCPKSFGTRKILEEHFDRNHASSFKCKHCGKEFNSWRALGAHERFQHKERKTLPKPQPQSPIKAVDTSQDSLLICGICCKVFPDQSGMRNHLKAHKADSVENKPKKKPTEKPSKPETVNDTRPADKGEQVKMLCNICNVSFDDRASLMDHMMSHTSISNDQIKQRSPLSKRTRLSSESPHQHLVKEKTPISKQEKKPFSKQGKTPVIKQEKMPMKKQGKTPVTKQEKTPIIKQEKTPIIKQEKTPINKQEKTPITKQQKTPINKQEKTPINKQEKTLNTKQINTAKVSASLTRAKAVDMKMSTNKTNNKKQNIMKRKLEEDQITKSELPQKKKKLDQNDKNFKNDAVSIQKKIKQEVSKQKIKQEVQNKDVDVLKQEAPKKKMKLEGYSKEGHVQKQEVPKKKLKQEVQNKDSNVKLKLKKGMKKRKLAVGLFRKKLVAANKSTVNIAKKVPIREIKCFLCNKNFKHMHAKQVHMINVHKRIANSLKDKYCKKCKILYKSEQNLKQHDKIAHKKIVKRQAKEQEGKKLVNKQKFEGKKQNNGSTDAKIFPCSQCNAKFTSERGLKIHHKRVHSWQTAFAKTGVRQQCLMCLECQKLFKSGSEYKEHLKTFHTMEIVDNGVLKTITSTELEVEIKKEAIDEELVGEKASPLEQTLPAFTCKYLQCKICNIVVGTDLELSTHVKSFHPEILVNPIDELSLGTSSVGSDLNTEREILALYKDNEQSILEPSATLNVEATSFSTAGVKEAPYPVSCVVVDVDTSLMNSPQLFSVPVIKLDRLSSIKKMINLTPVEPNRSEHDVDNSSRFDTEFEQDPLLISKDNIDTSTDIGNSNYGDKESSMNESMNETGLVITSTISEADAVFNSENISNETDKNITTTGNAADEDESDSANTPGVETDQSKKIKEITEQNSSQEIDVSSKNDLTSGETYLGSERTGSIVFENESNTFDMEPSSVSEAGVMVNTENINEQPENVSIAISNVISTENISGITDVNAVTDEGTNMKDDANKGVDSDLVVNAEDIQSNTLKETVIETNEYVENAISGIESVDGVPGEGIQKADLARQSAETDTVLDNRNIFNESENDIVDENNECNAHISVANAEIFHEVSEQVVGMNAITEQSAVHEMDVSEPLMPNTIMEESYIVNTNTDSTNNEVESASGEIEVTEQIMSNTDNETCIVNTPTNIINVELERDGGEIGVTEPLMSNTFIEEPYIVNTVTDNTNNELESAVCEIGVTEPMMSNADVETYISNTHSDNTNYGLESAMGEIEITEQTISETNVETNTYHVVNSHSENATSEHEGMEVDNEERDVGYLGIKIGMEGRDIILEGNQGEET